MTQVPVSSFVDLRQVKRHFLTPPGRSVASSDGPMLKDGTLAYEVKN
jgi:hypothetical protein